MKYNGYKNICFNLFQQIKKARDKNHLWLLLYVYDKELFFNDHYFFNYISLTDIIDNIKTFINFPETGMYAVEVAGIGAAVADKKLGTTGIFTGMSH